MSDGKRKTDPRALEEYLEKPDTYEGKLDPDAKQLVDSLQRWRHEATLQPRAGFTNELADQLQQENSAARQPWSVLPVVSRLLAGAAAVAALLLFVFFVTSLFREPVTELTSGERETPLPPVQLVGTGGLFAGVEFRRDAPFSDEAQQIPLYVIDAAPLPETPDDVRQVALDLGMENPRVYEARGLIEGWIVQDDAGQRLTIDRNHVRFPIVYHAPVSSTSETSALSFEEARSLAVQFLEGAHLLPEGYELREQLREGDDGLARVEFIPTLEGQPVHYLSSEVAIGPSGTVVEARVQPLTFAATGETITAQSASAAFNEVLESRVTIDGRRHSQLTGMTKTYFPSFTQAQQGTKVTLVGYVTTLQPVTDPTDSRSTELELSQHPEGANAFKLTGPSAAELENELFAEVTGTLVEQLAGGQWRMVVSEWKSLDVENVMQCKEGTLHREQGEVTLLTSKEESFTLAYPPDAPTGEPAYVCAVFHSQTPAHPIWWLSVTSPAPVEKRAFNTIAEASDLEPALEASDEIPSTLIVDWATPGYIYTPDLREHLPGQPLVPSWLFYAESPDGTMQFVLRVPAEAADGAE